MRKLRSLGSNVASAIVGALVGALIVMGGDSLTRTPDPEPPGRPPSPEIHVLEKGSGGTRSPSRILLAWSPREGLPATTERVLEGMPVVENLTTVFSGVDWIMGSRTSSGGEIDDPAPGFGIPVEVALVRPEEYARFVPAGEREAILSMKPGDALFARTEAKLRGAAEGLRVRLEDRSVEIKGVVSDTAAAGYEMLVAGKVPSTWGRVDRFYLIELARASGRTKVERRVDSLLASGAVARVRAQGETPFLRYGDAVLPQMLIKEAFGEFAGRPLSNGTIDIESGWRRRNIITRAVPIIGAVTCHRALFPQLRAALEEVADAGLASRLDRDQYAGCYVPRFIDRDPRGRLSHHSWGIAFDINALENAYGTKADLDRGLVEIFESHGFTWGGRWLIPDGMHFEWVRFP